ncbi:MAG TPA: hypothetical protein VGI54_04490 [Solirubrobacteraceae bacterium]|jgi:hypothetical protein
MSGKVKKVTITGAALLAMGMTGPSVAAAESGDGENEQAPTVREAALPPAATPASDERGATSGPADTPRRG